MYINAVDDPPPCVTSHLTEYELFPEINENTKCTPDLEHLLLPFFKPEMLLFNNEHCISHM